MIDYFRSALVVSMAVATLVLCWGAYKIGAKAEADRIERQCYLVGRVEIDGVLFGCGVMRTPQASTEKIKWN